jgi:rhodanese-related sulfurtransferase
MGFHTFVIIIVFSFQLLASTIHTLSHQDTYLLFQSNNAFFIDIRNNKEYQKGTILGSQNISLHTYQKQKKFLPSKDSQIVLFCYEDCEDILKFNEYLKNDGYKYIYYYPHGYKRWLKQKLPSQGVQKNCNKIAYKPNASPIQIADVTIYKGEDENMIDQFWFAEQIKNKKIKSDIVLVDIRTKSEFQKGHLKGAINLPWNNKKFNYQQLPKNKLIIIYCNTGLQSADAVLSLPKKLRKNIFYFDENIDCIKNECNIIPNENI